MNTPIRPLNLDFNDNRYLLAYYVLYSSTGLVENHGDLNLDRYDYFNNNCFFAFDINQGSNSENVLTLEKNGNIRLELKFSEALVEAVNCVIYLEHQSVLEIDKLRQFSLN